MSDLIKPIICAVLLLLWAGSAEAQSLNQQRLDLKQQLQTLPDTKNNTAQRADILMDLGKVNIDLRDYRAATTNLHAARLLYRKVRNYEGQAKAHSLLGDIDRYQGEYQSSYQHYLTGLTLTERIRGSKIRADVLWRLGELYRFQQMAPTAEGYYSEAREIFAQIGSAAGEGKVALSWAKMNYLDGNLETAERDFIAAAGLFTQAGSTNDVGYAYFGAGKIQDGQKDQNIYRNYLMKAITAFHSANNRPLEAESLLALGNLEKAMFRDGDAEVHLVAAQGLYRILEDVEGEGDATRALGNLYRAIGDNRQALAHFEVALRLFRLTGANEKLTPLLQNLGDLERSFGRSAKARDYYAEALTIYQASADQLGQANIMLVLGLVESGQDTALALSYFDNAARLYRAVGMVEASNMAREAGSRLRADISN